MGRTTHPGWTNVGRGVTLSGMAVAIPAFTLGDRLTKARSTAGISVQEMADRLGVSRNTISNYEAERTRPPLAVLILWSQFCEVPEWWLLGDRPPGGTITSGYPVVPRLKWRERVAA